MDVVYDDGDKIDGLSCQAARQEIGLVSELLGRLQHAFTFVGRNGSRFTRQRP